MTRHASTGQLASYAVGELKRREAARVAAHVAVCPQCADLRQDLADVPAVLAASPYPSLPESVSGRIEAALRVEVNRRFGAAPASEAGRRELPAGSRGGRAGPGRPGWRLPGLPVRPGWVAAVAGVLLLVGGGYLVASNMPTGAGSGASSAPAAPPVATQPMTEGPTVTYGTAGSQHTVHTVSSSTNFEPGQLHAQALDAVHEAEVKGLAGTQASGASAPQATLGPLAGSAAGASAQSQLAGCIDAVGPGLRVLLLELASFEGKPATIIVFESTPASQAEVVVAASSCSAAAPDVLARAALGHL